jgi:alginate O-acetyltransferase complex protein AlgI
MDQTFEYIKNLISYHKDQPLLFTQVFFWGFFVLVLFVYSFIYKKNRLKHGFLFIMSLYFYYKSGGYFLSLLLFTSVVDFTLGRLIFNAQSTLKKKLLVSISVFVNLGVLAYFKYTFFFINSFNSIFYAHLQVVNLFARWSNELLGNGFSVSTIILPVGISFFTFQSLSYTIEIYRGNLKPVKNFIDFGFYVSFFPQLVAGPIVKAVDFIPQLYQKYSLTKEEVGHAFFLILNGMIKKMLISDYISLNFVDRVFDSPHTYSGFENLMAIYGYTIQIYCDFSGYTDIAIGVALLLGYRLNINFNSPYKSLNITEFWRRWHISLSTWLRDYLYISLGGNRKGKFRTYVNLMITMLLGGLWHGASLKFIIWGGLHGAGLVVHKLWMKISPFAGKKLRYGRFISLFFTFHFVCFAWIFFRARDIQTVGVMLQQIVSSFSFQLIPQMIISYRLVFGIMLLGYFIHWLPSNFKENYRGWFIQTSVYAKVTIAVMVVFVLYQAKSSVLQPFIYFQF